MLSHSLIRTLLMRLAVSRLAAARWTDGIQDEWIRTQLADRPDLTPERLQRTRQFMEQAVPDAQVTGDEGIVASLSLPDPDDRHVLAAALHAGADLLVTFNLKDFPLSVAHPLDVLTPDGLVRRLMDSGPEATVAAVEGLRCTLRQPASPPPDWLKRLEGVGLAEAALRLKTFHNLPADTP